MEHRDLQQTIPTHEKKLEQQVKASTCQHQQLSGTTDIPQATATAAGNITALSWKELKSAPEVIQRGAAVIDGETIYINSQAAHKVFSCQVASEGLLWTTLPESLHMNFSLAIIHGLLTCVGGCSGKFGTCTNTLHSLTGEYSKRQWSEAFPPMPTARSHTASVTTEQTLVVAGGCDGIRDLDTVEVMNIATKQWTIAQRMPHPFGVITGTICREQLFLGGGYIGLGKQSNSVLMCSLTDLFPPQSSDATPQTLPQSRKPGVWREIKNLPVTLSTLITLDGHLLAIGGLGDPFTSTADIRCYDHESDSWQVVSKMRNKRYLSLSAVVPKQQLVIVVGGWGAETLVEIGGFPLRT